jgi:hypothetical protein
MGFGWRLLAFTSLNSFKIYKILKLSLSSHLFLIVLKSEFYLLFIIKFFLVFISINKYFFTNKIKA